MLCDFPWYPLVPSVYYTGLSYYEDLCKLSGALNQVISEVQKIDYETTQSDIAELKQKQSELTTQMDNLSGSVGKVMENVNNALSLYNDNVMLELQNATNNMTTYVSSQLATIKQYLDYQDNSILSELKYQINLLKNSLPDLTNVYVVSPYTGLTVPIQTAINELWEYMRLNSLTAMEYDSLQLTAEQYDSYNLTAYVYDFTAKEYIWRNPDLYMYHPWSGEYVHTREVISFLTTLLKQMNLLNIEPVSSNHALTAEDYDSKNITASNFDSLPQVNAKEYDWNGSAIFV